MKEIIEYSELTRGKLNIIYVDDGRCVVEVENDTQIYSPVFGTVIYTHQTPSNKICVIIKCNNDKGILIDDLDICEIKKDDNINLSQLIGKATQSITLSYLSKYKSNYPVRLLDITGIDSEWYKHNPLPFLKGEEDMTSSLNNINNLNVNILSHDLQGTPEDEKTMTDITRQTLTNNRGE